MNETELTSKIHDQSMEIERLKRLICDYKAAIKDIYDEDEDCLDSI